MVVLLLALSIVKWPVLKCKLKIAHLTDWAKKYLNSNFRSIEES
jgi:hypothetical protein